MRYVIIHADTFKIDPLDSLARTFGPVKWENRAFRLNRFDKVHKYKFHNWLSLDVNTLQKKIKKIFEECGIGVFLRKGSTDESLYYIFRDEDNSPLVIVRREKSDLAIKPDSLYIRKDYGHA